MFLSALTAAYGNENFNWYCYRFRFRHFIADNEKKYFSLLLFLFENEIGLKHKTMRVWFLCFT